MPWINTITNEVSEEYPYRVRLENNLTLTGPEVSDELLASTGWQWQEPTQPEERPYRIVTVTTTTEVIVYD